LRRYCALLLEAGDKLRQWRHRARDPEGALLTDQVKVEPPAEKASPIAAEPERASG
jgi:hypothetical protein